MPKITKRTRFGKSEGRGPKSERNPKSESRRAPETPQPSILTRFLPNEAIARGAVSKFRVQCSIETTKTLRTQSMQEQRLQQDKWRERIGGHRPSLQERPLPRFLPNEPIPHLCALCVFVVQPKKLRNEPISMPGSVARDETRIFTDKNLRNEANHLSRPCDAGGLKSALQCENYQTNPSRFPYQCLIRVSSVAT
jgi:hypothetical protein